MHFLGLASEGRPLLKRSRLIGLALAVLVVLPLCSSYTSALPEEHVLGIWSDSCPCSISCSCWKMKRASVPNCTDVQVYFVTDGIYRGVNLTGKGFVIIGSSREPSEAPRPLHIFLDAKATPEQNSSLLSIARGITGNPVGLAISKHVIDWDIQNNRHKLMIQGLLSYEISLDDPERAAAPEIRDYVYPWLFGVRQGMAKHVEVKATNPALRYENSNALFAYFDVDVSH